MAELILSVPLKEPYDVDVVTPLQNLLTSTYSTAEQPVNFSEAVSDFAKLRNKAIWKPLEKNEGVLELIYRYYDQLCALESKIPQDEIACGIPFRWKDAFDKGSLFSGKANLTVASLAYEKICILFNIAALQSSVAASQSIETDEGRKTAAKLLQQSAGIFNYLTNIVISCIHDDPTPDLNPDTLSALSALMLAQAQEIFVQKAIQDRMKDAVIAKLSAQCEELYSVALKQMQKESLRAVWEAEWVPLVSGKQAGYHGLAHFYQSLVCNANKSAGEEIARLKHALEEFQVAQTKSYRPMFQNFVAKAEKALTVAKKDNDMIYNERVPDIKTVDPIKKAALAKLLPLPQQLGQDFKDVFQSLMPIVVHKAVIAHNEKKSELIKTEIGRLHEANEKLNSFLTSVNLPAALNNAPLQSSNAALNAATDQLRKLMTRVELMKAERSVMESELHSAKTDVQSTFMESFSKKEPIHEQAITLEILSTVFGPIQRQIQDSLQKQGSLIAEIQRLHTEFCSEKGISIASRDTQDKCVIA